MAYEHDEMNKKASAQKRRKKLRRQQQFLRWTAFGLILAVCVLMLVVIVTRDKAPDPSASGTAASTQSSAPTTQTTAPTTETTAPTQTTSPVEPETVIKLVFGGDLNVTDKVVAAGDLGGSYDYSGVFQDITPILADAHATFLNLEGGFYGPDYGSASASAPSALAESLAAAGVDMLQLANSRSVFNGLTGLSATMNTVRSAGMRPLGVFANQAEREESQGFTLVNIGGIRVAIVAFTKGMDGISLPSGGEGCVNLLYKDYSTTYQNVDTEGITAILKAAEAQKPDITIAMVHWGSEYNNTISPSQKAIVELMQGLGVDAIIGTHSHFVQQVDYNASAGTVVAYSLGDFLGDGEKAGTNYSILLQLQITRDNRTGKTRISGCDYTGVYVLTPEKDDHPLQIVRIQAAMAMYENDHVDKISDTAYENMRYAWQRIQARVSG